MEHLRSATSENLTACARGTCNLGGSRQHRTRRARTYWPLNSPMDSENSAFLFVHFRKQTRKPAKLGSRLTYHDSGADSTHVADQFLSLPLRWGSSQFDDAFADSGSCFLFFRVTRHTKRLIVRGGRHVPFSSQHRQKRLQLAHAHVAWMPQPMLAKKKSHPV